MSCVCGNLECTCQGRCLCVEEECTCERCDDLRSGRTLGSSGYELLRNQRSHEKQLHKALKVSAEGDAGVQRRSLSVSYQEANSNASEKSLKSYRSKSSPSSPGSSTKRSPKELAPIKRTSGLEYLLKYLGSTKCMDQSIIQSKSDLVASSADSETLTPDKNTKYVDQRDKTIPMDVDPSSGTNYQSPGKKGKCVGENASLNRCEGTSKSLEVTPDSSSSRNTPPNPSFNQLQLPNVNAIQLSPGRKYTVMIRQNMNSSSTESSRSRQTSVTVPASNDDVFLQPLIQPSHETTEYCPKFDLPQKRCSESASASPQRKSRGASGTTLEQESPEGCKHSSGSYKSNSSSDVSSRRCMPIISPQLVDKQSKRFDFAWHGSPQRSSSAESFFDQFRQCSALRASGNLDDMYRMNRVVRQFVEPFEKFRKNFYQQHSEEVENLLKCDMESVDPDAEETAEVPKFIHGVIQGDPQIDDPFTLKGLPYDLTSDDSNAGSETPSETEGQ